MRAAALLLAAALSAFAGARAETGRVPVSFLFSYDPDRPENPATRRIQSLAAAEGTIEPVKWGSLVLPGGGGRASFMLALAGGAGLAFGALVSAIAVTAADKKKSKKAAA